MKKFTISTVRILFLSSLLLSSAISRAATYYVSPAGSDGNPGTFSKPLLTLQKAADRAMAGDSVLVMKGTYAGFMIKDKSGRADGWIVFKPYGDQDVTIDIYKNPSSLWQGVHIDGSSYIEVNGFKITDSNPLYDSDDPDDFRTGLSHGAVKISMYGATPPSYIRIINNEMFRIGGGGILSDYESHHCEFINNSLHTIGLAKRGAGIYAGGDDHLIKGNVIRDAYGYGITVYSEGGPKPERNIVEDNICYSNGSLDYGVGDPVYNWGRTGDGIQISGGGRDHIVRNNIVYDNMNWGIRVSGRNCLIVNNTSYHNGYQGLYLYDDNNSTARNNISLENKGQDGYPGQMYIGAGNTSDHNSWDLAISDARFVDASRADFRLQQDSPAIDSGSGDRAPAWDIEGNVRPAGAAWDLGAHEFAGESSVAEIVDIRLKNIDQTDHLTAAIPGVWYDLELSFSGWDDISYANVWVNHSTNSEGTVANRGGRFFAASNYVMSYSISTDAIWACETEGSSQGVNVTGTLGLYIDDDAGEYRQNSAEQCACARFRWLDGARSGVWSFNAYIVKKNGQNTTLFSKEIELQSALADDTPPSKPQNVNVMFIKP
ncbi:right-handed parallel beta-helix repeat-containing protein [candidate division KSB1 bacterium]|nr:right-handed parallel beta-helix repeat-containing protein [candidate division KSB1 bacterium]RQW01847.1 MAG: right-handed parallel beta-helix repeat-containing protein [candidate division KSB1 bacterium]